MNRRARQGLKLVPDISRGWCVHLWFCGLQPSHQPRRGWVVRCPHRVTVCSLAQQNPAQESLCLPEINSQLKSHCYGCSHPLVRALTKDPHQAYFPKDEHYSATSLICDKEGKGKKGKLSKLFMFHSKWNQLDDVMYDITVTYVLLACTVYGSYPYFSQISSSKRPVCAWPHGSL